MSQLKTFKIKYKNFDFKKFSIKTIRQSEIRGNAGNRKSGGMPAVGNASMLLIDIEQLILNLKFKIRL